MFASKERFAFITFWKFKNISKHAIWIAWVFESYEKIRNIGFSECRTVFFFVLLYCFIFLLGFYWAFDRFASFSICDWKQICILSLTVHKIANPACWIKTSENVAGVRLNEDQSWTHIVTLCMEPLCSSSVDYCFSLYFLCVLVEHCGTCKFRRETNEKKFRCHYIACYYFGFLRDLEHCFKMMKLRILYWEKIEFHQCFFNFLKRLKQESRFDNVHISIF